MCTVPKRSFLSGSTFLRYHRGTLHGRQRTTPFSVNSACAKAGCQGIAACVFASGGTCRFSCFHCYFYCESVSLGSSVLSCRRTQCVVWVVGPQYKSYACSAPGRASVYACSAHGRLPLGTAYCALYVLVELTFTYQTIVALSAELTKVHTDVTCVSTFHFYWGSAPNQKVCGTSGKNISLK